MWEKSWFETYESHWGKIEMESVEIIKQDDEMPKLKSVIEKEKYPNLFKLPRLRYQIRRDSLLIDTMDS